MPVDVRALRGQGGTNMKPQRWVLQSSLTVLAILAGGHPRASGRTPRGPPIRTRVPGKSPQNELSFEARSGLIP